MRKIILAITALLYAYSSDAQCKLDYSNYQIVLDENFDHISSLTELTDLWQFQHDDPGWGWGGHDNDNNWDGEHYLPSQVELIKTSSQSGFLRLNADRVPTPDTVWSDWLHDYRHCIFRSGMIQLKRDLTYPPFEGSTLTGAGGSTDYWYGFTYGMFEIRMKIPKGYTFPAFWLMGPTQLNIFEGKRTERKYAVGYTDEWGTHGTDARELKKMDADDLGDDFHTYTAVWTPDEITYFFDGREVCTFRNAKVANLNKMTTCANTIIASMQMDGWAHEVFHCHMDIDYIRVYKPIGGNYMLPYKTNNEYQHEHVVEKAGGISADISKFPNAIAINPENPDEIFYRGTDNYVYVADKSSGDWFVRRLTYSDGAPVLVDGDLVYNYVHHRLLYVGADGRINVFGRSDTEPTGFYHDYLRPDWWVGTYDHISNAPGSLQVSPNGDIFFRGTDDKMHRYYYAADMFNHMVLTHPMSTNTLVKGDILVDPSNFTVMYKGFDNKLQNFYLDAGVYHHIYIDLSVTSDYAVKPGGGNMTFAPSIPGIVYIGTDNKIHLFKWNSTWSHELLPYSYISSSYAKGSIDWDDNRKTAYYCGYDARIHSFVKTPSTWEHKWVDDYWRTDEYCSYNNDFPAYSASIKVGSEATGKSIWYTANTYPVSWGDYTPARHSELTRFRYLPCEVLISGTDSKANLNKQTRNMIAPEVLPLDYTLKPNPASSFLTIQSNQDYRLKQEIEVLNITGVVVLRQSSSQASTTLDLSQLNPGLYVLRITTGGRAYRYKFNKN